MATRKAFSPRMTVDGPELEKAIDASKRLYKGVHDGHAHMHFNELWKRSWLPGKPPATGPPTFKSLTGPELQRFAAVLYLHVVNQRYNGREIREGVADLASKSVTSFNLLLTNFLGYKHVQLMNRRGEEKVGNVFDWMQEVVENIGLGGADWSWVYLCYRLAAHNSMPPKDLPDSQLLEWTRELSTAEAEEPDAAAGASAGAGAGAGAGAAAGAGAGGGSSGGADSKAPSAPDPRVRWILDPHFDEASRALNNTRVASAGFDAFVSFLAAGPIPEPGDQLNHDLQHWLYFDLVHHLFGSLDHPHSLPLLPSRTDKNRPCLGRSQPAILCLLVPVLWQYVVFIRGGDSVTSHRDFEAQVSDPMSQDIAHSQWTLMWGRFIGDVKRATNMYPTFLRLMCYIRFQDPSSLMRRLVQASRGVPLLRELDGESSTFATLRVLFARIYGASATGLGLKPSKTRKFTELQFKWFKDRNPELLVLLSSVPLFLRWALRLDRSGRGTSTVKVLDEHSFVSALNESDSTVKLDSWAAALLETDVSKSLLLLSRLLWVTRMYSSHDPKASSGIVEGGLIMDPEDGDAGGDGDAAGGDDDNPENAGWFATLFGVCGCVERQ